MTGITHKQAGSYMRKALDGLLTADQRRDLTAHLDECEACRFESESLSSLTARVQNGFHSRWDTQHGPSTNVLTKVRSQTRRIIMSNRIKTGLKTVTGIVALLALGVVINFFVAQMKNNSTVATSNGIQNIDNPTPVKNLPLIVFVAGDIPSMDIYVVKSDGTGLKNLTNSPYYSDRLPVWSPDGNKIAFVSDRDGNDEIYVMNPDGSNVTRLTNDPASDTNPLWSPDGTKIAYASGDFTKNNTNIYVMDSNGQNQRRLTDYVPNTTVWPSVWSPDSQFIFFEAYRQIVKVNASDGNITTITPQTDVKIPLQFALSKDGSTLLYQADCNSNDISTNEYCTLVKSIQANGENDKTLATLKKPEACLIKQTATWTGEYVKWSPDQTKLLFAFTCEADGWLYIADADGSNFKPLTNYPILGNGPDNEVAMFDWSPDSQSIVFMSALDQPNKDNLYILNVNETLNNPATRPARITNGSAIDSSPAWQPALANNITDQKPTPSLLKSSLTIREAAALAGFDVLVPSYLPEGYAFQGADYDTQTQQVTLRYISSSGDTNKKGAISIYEKRGDYLKGPAPSPYVTPVPVGDAAGELIDGVWVYDSVNVTTPRWEGNNNYDALRWQKDNMAFTIEFLGGILTPPIQLDGLTAIAESLKSAITAQQSLTSTATPAQKLYSGLIAFTSQKSGNPEIYTMHADGSNVIKLTNNPTDFIVNTSPAWSPDGKRIAFYSDRADPHGNPDVFVMNSDGKELTQLTDSPGWDEMLAWSPDGQKIVYLSNQGRHDSAKGQLIVVNPDGSNKIVLTKEIGSYSFLGWSPDGQKIVYAKQKVDVFGKLVAADGTYIVERNGSNLQQIGVGGTDKIYWSDAQHFYGVGSDPGSSEGSIQPLWTIYKSSTDSSPTLKLASYGTPIVAVFDKTYIVEGQNALLWYTFDNNSKPLASWEFRTICDKPSDRYLDETTHSISPSKQYAFGTLYCFEGKTWLYLEKTDGSEIKLFTGFSVSDPLQVMDASWSPDNKFVTVTIAYRDGSGADIYLFDIEKMLKDPSTKPIQLTADGAFKFGATWQPQP